MGLPADVLNSITSQGLDEALSAASQLADGYLRQQYDLPLKTWGADLTRAICHIASYDVLTARGYNPEAGGDVTIRIRYEDAIRWLERVSDGKISPSIVDSSVGATDVGDTTAGGPELVTSSSRGWSSRGTGRSPGSFESD